MTFFRTGATLGASLLLAACMAQAGEGSAVDAQIETQAAALAEAGLKDEVGLQFVEDLTTEIGARLAGSPKEKMARDWAVAELKALGFQNVRVEDFTIPYWSRVTESAEIVGDHPQSLVMTALGGSRATPAGGLTANVVRFPSLAALEAAPKADVVGRIVFIDEIMLKTMDGASYGMGGMKRRFCAKRAAEKGAVACLIRSAGTQPHRMAHTGGMSREGALGDLPAAAVSGPDADQITRLLERGPVKVKLQISVETAEAAPSGNVIAEVEGSDLKDEIVLIGCHLDSWDPGTGALDDGAGCGIVVGAANLINALPGKPRRTIRVVLYGSEEVGLFGADAYARAHGDNLSKHVLASESDFGAGRIWRFQTRFGEGAADYATALHRLLQPLGVTPGDNRSNGGPDIGVLARAGVPVVTPSQDGTDYFDYHHTPDDTFDKINPDTFRQNVAVYAAFTYMAAETGWDFRKSGAAGATSE